MSQAMKLRTVSAATKAPLGDGATVQPSVQGIVLFEQMHRVSSVYHEEQRSRSVGQSVTARLLCSGIAHDDGNWVCCCAFFAKVQASHSHCVQFGTAHGIVGVDSPPEYEFLQMTMESVVRRTDAEVGSYLAVRDRSCGCARA